MSSSFTIIASSSFTNGFNREEAAMAMIQQPNPVAAPPKKRRNPPGNPNPDSEVVALSPETIMATNRFLCEACNRGFPRKQNLQLHRRLHSLPFTLKQTSNKEVRRKVYVCPEPTCIHHDPSRALGDITGIKKHYYRKHCEKKWKCEKCSKCYAVQTDLKSHSRTCGNKEYRCDCGSNFARRDGYISHRTLCDALLLQEETARNHAVRFTTMAAATAGDYAGGRNGFYVGSGSASALTHNNHFGNNQNSGFTPLAAGYNLNRSSSDKFRDLLPHQSANPNHVPINFLLQQCSPNQAGLLAQNNQSLMQRCYHQKNRTNYANKTSVTSRFTNGAADDSNDTSALLRRCLNYSSSSSVVVNDHNDNGLMNSRVATTDHRQGWSGGSIFDLHFGNNRSMGGSDKNKIMTFDFLGGMVSNVNDRGGSGGRNGAPSDTEMKFSHQNRSFG